MLVIIDGFEVQSLKMFSCRCIIERHSQLKHCTLWAELTLTQWPGDGDGDADGG